MLALIDLLAAGAHPAMHDGVWVSPDAKRAILLIQTAAPAYDTDAQATTLAEIQRAFADAKASISDGQAAKLVMTGPPVFGVESRAQIRGDVSRLSLIATGLVSAILLAAYRSPLLLGLSLLPVASGILAGIGAVALGFGYVHGITLGFGVTLMGEAVDYAVYLLSRTKPGTAPETTLARIWPTLRLGLMTSLAGFGAMLFSGFPGFVQLGLLTMIGLSVAAIVTRFVLPHIIPRSFSGVRLAALEPIFAGALAAAPRLRLPLALILAGAVVLLFFHQGSYWEDELSSMNPVPRAQLALDHDLRADLNAPDVRHMIVIMAASEEEALERSTALGAWLRPLVAAGTLSGIDAPNQFLPTAAEQRARQAAIPDGATLKANLTSALQGLPFRPDTFAPFLAAAEKARTQPLLSTAALAGTSLSLKLAAALFQRGSSAIAILQLHGVTDSARIAAVLQKAAVPGASLLDLTTESDALLSRYLAEAKMLSLAGSLAIIVLLAATLRSASRVGRVLAPLAAAVVVTAALLTFGTHQLSVFNLFGLLLVAAVGSNYCLFFERGEAEAGEGPRILASLLLANICTVIGFGILSFSGVPILRGIGMTVAIGTALSLVFGAVLAARPAR
jgi:predicted exporter